jgi:dTDP-4-dehydrorhamnose reductase
MATVPKILVTGAGGQLGKELADLAPRFPAEFLFTTRDQLPITDKNKLEDFFAQNRPQYCINAAAFTAVDKAEMPEFYQDVLDTNADSVNTIAACCKKSNTKLIQISTDYVFDGSGNSPYKEDDPTNPVNLYGASKLKGEEFALEANGIVIRTSWVYSSYGNNFVKTILRLLKERDEIKVVNDQLGSPTYAADLAEVILHMIRFPHWQNGIYHYTNDGIISWYDFADAIREFSGSTCVIKPVSTPEYPTAAKRPAYSVLDKTKIRQVFGIRLKFWMDSLAVCLEQLIK